MTQTQPIKLKGFGPDETLTDMISDRNFVGHHLIIGGNCYHVDTTMMPSGPAYKLINSDEMQTVAMAGSREGILFEILKLADRNNELL